MGEDKIAIGLVGAGKIARDQHVPAIAASDSFALVGTTSPNSSITGIPNHPSIAAMKAAHPDMSAVSICTPPGVRLRLVEQALVAGLDVMIEKPPAPDVELALEMARLAAEHGRTILATWHSRESDCVDHTREWLSGKSITSIAIEWKEDIRKWHPGQDWILQSGGFGVFDPGINALSILTALLPGAITIESAQTRIPSNCSEPIAATFVMKSHDGTPISADFDFLETGSERWNIEIETAQGCARLSEGGRRLDIDGVEQCRTLDHEYPRLYQRFSQLVLSRESDFDIRPLELACTVLSSAKESTVEEFRF